MPHLLVGLKQTLVRRGRGVEFTTRERRGDSDLHDLTTLDVIEEVLIAHLLEGHDHLRSRWQPVERREISKDVFVWRVCSCSAIGNRRATFSGHGNTTVLARLCKRTRMLGALPHHRQPWFC